MLWWRSVELPTFALKEALTDSSPAPILFVTPCSSLDKVRKLYAEVEPLGSFAAQIGKLPQNGARVYYGFKLGGPRGPIPSFDGC